MSTAWQTNFDEVLSSIQLNAVVLQVHQFSDNGLQNSVLDK
jgi:hypothetical protein